jgi:phosphatidate cytidylyltransferase
MTVASWPMTVAGWIETLPLARNTALVLSGAAVVLFAGSLLRWWWLRGTRSDEFRERMGSLAVWWVMLGALAVAGAAGALGVIVLVTAVSAWALGEYFQLVADDASWRPVRWLAWAALPVQAVCIYLDWRDATMLFLPLGMLLLIPAALVLGGRTRGFLQDASRVFWGLMMTGYALSHAASLSVLPESWNPRGGSGGWFVFLILLTQSNDIAQALWGRRFGRHPLARRVSPHKTWEGLLAGVVTTVVLAVVLGAWLTPLTSIALPALPVDAEESADGLSSVAQLPAVWPAVGAGLLIAAAGLMGDLTISGVKRDLGVKDSGRTLPGQGGILDRIDSLIFAAPVFYYYVRWLHA